MSNLRPSTIVFNGINNLGLEISKQLSQNSSVVVVGKSNKIIENQFPKHISVIENNLLNSIKLSGVDTIVILYHEKIEDLVSAQDLVSHAKFLADIFQVATTNNARVVLTTSFAASKNYTFAKYADKDQPYDFSSFQNFVEKLALEQNRKTPTYILRIGDIYGEPMSAANGVIYRIIKDALESNYIRVDEDGLEKLYPISSTDISQIVQNVLSNTPKTGIYTVAPAEGLTQMAFANICMQYATNVSHIKFVKPKFSTYAQDVMYENIYTPAPYLTDLPDLSRFEQDIPKLLANFKPQSNTGLKEESEPEEPKKKINPSVVLNKIFFIRFGIFSVLFLLFLGLLVVPISFLMINSKLLSDSNRIFFNNYNKTIVAELSEDSRYNREKSQSLLDSLSFVQWMLPLVGDDYKNNQNFLNAQKNYFEALSYSKDYKFLNIPETSRGIVQVHLQKAKELIKEVDKSKLYGDLEQNFDQMKKVIEEARV